MHLVIALLLAQVQIIDHGRNRGQIKTLACVGSNLTCNINSHGWIEIAAIASSSDGGTVLLPACPAGNVVTSDGGVLFCVSNISTATALAADPTDCAGGQYATTIDSSGNLTCAQVTYSQLGGTEPAGGSNTQVQYNNGGNLGGITNFTSDGTDPGFANQQSLPSVSTAREVYTSYSPMTNIPPVLEAANNTWGLSIPQGMMSAYVFNNGADGTGNWMFSGARASNFAATSNFNYSQGVATGNVGAVGTINWATTNQRTRTIFVNYGTASGTSNFSVGGINEAEFKCWRGNATGVGGCLYYTRVFVNVINNKQMLFFGLANSTGSFGTPTILMSAQTNTFYVGNDVGQSTLHVCSNDNSGSATCVDLGSNFPAQTQNAMYDIWLFMPPNATMLFYDVERYDSRFSANGALDGGDNPQNTVQLAWHDLVNLGDGGVQNQVASFGWNSSLLWTNY